MKRIHTAVSFWRSFGVAIVCWTALGLFQGRVLFVNDRDHANYLPYAHYFVWAGIDAFSWAMITPFLFLFARNFPFQRQHWLLRTLQYAVLGCLVVLAHPALKSPAWLYKPDQHQTLVQTFFHLARKELPETIQVYIILCFVNAYQNTRREARWSQLREAELVSRISVAELHMLRMQLNPHFLFNALQAATVLVHEDPLAAENVLQRLSELLRVALDDMRSLQVPLEQEITFLEHYVEIQKQRFQKRLIVRLHIAPDTLPILVPTLLLQPLVENAIHHGIGRHKGSDVVEVTSRREGQQLVVEIRNFASSLLDNNSSSGHGVGLKNTRARLEQMYGDQATVELLPLLPTGVCATVTLPVERTS
jgi:two-component system, LytTR family, sensor kinase